MQKFICSKVLWKKHNTQTGDATFVAYNWRKKNRKVWSRQK